MPTKPLTIYTRFYSGKNYSLLMKRMKTETKMIMVIRSNIINTRDIPSATKILKELLPTIFVSKCYNEAKFPFCREVLETELGHLFEHILIEYLCLLKIENGYDNAEYTGLTKWNWHLFPKGSFHITVSASMKDSLLLTTALRKSMMLIDTIFDSILTDSLPDSQNINLSKSIKDERNNFINTSLISS